MSLSSVDMIIKELCRQTGEPEYRNYDDFIGPIRRGFSLLNIAAIQVVKHDYLPINNYNAIDWPCDCIKPIMVGLNRNGCTVTLDIDESLVPMDQRNSAITTLSDAEAEIANICNGAESGYQFEINSNGELYGLGSGFSAAGFCDHNKSTRQTHVKGSYFEDDEFLFVYLSDGIQDGLDQVPSETEVPLRSYALHEYYQIKNPGLSQQMWNKFELKDVPFLRKFYQSRTADDWAQAFNQNEKSSPK